MQLQSSSSPAQPPSLPARFWVPAASVTVARRPPGGLGPPRDAGGSQAVLNRAAALGAPKRDSIYPAQRLGVGREERTLPPTFLVAAGRPAAASARGGSSAGASGAQALKMASLGLRVVPPWLHRWVRGKLAGRAPLSGKAEEGGRGSKRRSLI